MASAARRPEGFVRSNRRVRYGVSGKKTHDARLVAAMTIQGIAHILTFNSADFARYPGITAIEP